MQEPPNEGPDDWFFNENSQKWLRHSGRAHWRRVLAEQAAWSAAHPDAGRQMLERLGVPAPIVDRLIASVSSSLDRPVRRYHGAMEAEPSEHEDAYYDAGVDLVVTHSGKARWRQRLDAAKAQREANVEQYEALPGTLRPRPANRVSQPADIQLVLDASAVVEFTRASVHVGEVIILVGEDNAKALLPLPCLLEAAQWCADRSRLDLLVDHQSVIVTGEEPSQWQALTEMYALTGRLDIATAALAAIDARAPLLTRQPGMYRGSGAADLVIPIED